MRPQPIEEWVQLTIDEKIPVVETSGRSPQAIVAPLHAAGVKIMHKVPGVRYAQTAERLGVDAICVVGHEAGGHPGMDEVTSLVLVPAAADAVKLPLVAGGGFADGRGLVAALALGADGCAHGDALHGDEGVSRAGGLQGVDGARRGDGDRLLHEVDNEPVAAGEELGRREGRRAGEEGRDAGGDAAAHLAARGRRSSTRATWKTAW